jgi:hypothetical protein
VRPRHIRPPETPGRFKRQTTEPSDGASDGTFALAGGPQSPSASATQRALQPAQVRAGCGTFLLYSPAGPQESRNVAGLPCLHGHLTEAERAQVKQSGLDYVVLAAHADPAAGDQEIGAGKASRTAASTSSWSSQIMGTPRHAAGPPFLPGERPARRGVLLQLALEQAGYRRLGPPGQDGAGRGADPQGGATEAAADQDL